MYILTKTQIKRLMENFGYSIDINTEVKYVSSDLEQVKEEFECLRGPDDDLVYEYVRTSTEDKLVQSSIFDNRVLDNFYQLDIHEV